MLNQLMALTGMSGAAGYSVDGIAATSATINAPQALWVDSTGGYYIADAGNARIRYVTVNTGEQLSFVVVNTET